MTQAQPLETSSKWAGFAAREQLMLAALMMPIALELVDSGMMSVALPQIQKDFGVRVDLLAWAVAAGFLPRVALMPIYGHIGDRIGKKQLFLLGLAIHTVGAMLGIFAPSFSVLIVGRLLQGVGGSSLPLAMALIADGFAPEHRGRALGIWNSAAPGGLILGPILGGFIVETFGWHAIFIVVAAGSVVAFFLVARLVPQASRGSTNSTFDWMGAISLVITISALLLATTTGSLVPLGSPVNLAFWAVSMTAVIAVLWNAWHKPHAFIGKDILTNRRFIVPALAVNLRMFAHDGARFLLVLYLANVFGQSPSAVGLLMLFYTVPLLIGVTYGGYLADRWASRTAGTLGMIGQVAGLAWLGVAGSGAGTVALAPGMAVAGLAGGISLVSFSKEAIGSLGPERVGLASGLYNTVRFAGTAAATPLLGLLLERGFKQQVSGEAASGPYQLAFQVLTITAAVGIAVAALIPAVPAGGSKLEEIQPDD